MSEPTESCHGGLIQENQPPEIPGRFRSTETAGGTHILGFERMKTLEPALKHRHANRVVDIAFAPDNAVLAGGYDAFVLWDPRGEARWRIEQVGEDMPMLWRGAFSPDGKALIAGGRPNLLCALDPATGRIQRTLPATANLFSIAFADDGSRFATGDRPQVRIWNRDADTPTTSVFAAKVPKVVAPPPVSSIAFSRDSTRLVVACGKVVTLGGSADGAVVYAATADRFGVSSAVLGHDGTIVSVGTASVIEVRDPSKKAKKPARRIATGSKTSELALDPTGTKLLSGGEGPLKLWDLASGTLLSLLTGPSQDVDAVAISPDGSRAAAAGLDQTVFVWDL